MGIHQLHIGIQEQFSPALRPHPAFQVENLGGLRGQLLKESIEIRDDEPLEGIDRFFVYDPFGNRLEFLEKNIKD